MAASFKEKNLIYNYSSDISSSRPLVGWTQSGPHGDGVVASQTECVLKKPQQTVPVALERGRWFEYCIMKGT